MKKLLQAFMWGFYMFALFFTTLMCILGSAYWTGMDIPAEIVVAALHNTLYLALHLTIPVALRWWLKDVSWGTFAVYFFLLSVGFVMQSVYQDLRDEVVLSTALLLAGMAGVPITAYFMYKNFLQVKTIIKESKEGRRY